MRQRRKLILLALETKREFHEPKLLQTVVSIRQAQDGSPRKTSPFLAYPRHAIEGLGGWKAKHPYCLEWRTLARPRALHQSWRRSKTYPVFPNIRSLLLGQLKKTCNLSSTLLLHCLHQSSSKTCLCRRLAEVAVKIEIENLIRQWQRHMRTSDQSM